MLVTYVAPLVAVLKGPLASPRGWICAAYYFAIQVPVYWVYARAWQLGPISEHDAMSALTLFALQFFQPALWFR